MVIRDAEDDVVSVAKELDFYSVEVFMVFNSEVGQREVLEKMSFGTLRRRWGVEVGGECVEGYGPGRAVESLVV